MQHFGDEVAHVLLLPVWLIFSANILVAIWRMADKTTTNVQPFKPVFLAQPGDPPVPWHRWIEMFALHLTATGFADTTANKARKAALLKASLGVEGYRVYRSLTTDVSESYDNAITTLTPHFDRRPSQVYLRAQFTRRMQQSGESIAQFVTVLRELAARCEFSANELSVRVRDQFVAWVRDDKIRERLLQEPPDRTLDQFVQLATTLEQAATSSHALAVGLSADTTVPSVRPNNTAIKVERISASKTNKPPFRSTANGKQPKNTATQRHVTCFACGNEGHYANSQSCPAHGRECRNCHRLGHFASRCTKNKSQPDAHNLPSRAPNQRGDASRAVTSSAVTISSLSDAGTGNLEHRTCDVNGIPLKLMVDTGSEVSVINYDTYRKFFSQLPLLTAAVNMKAYGAHPIHCCGYLEFSVSYNSRSLNNCRFFVTKQGDCVMGRDLFDALGFRIQEPDTTINHVQIGVSSLSKVQLTDFPSLLKSWGTIKGFQHEPRVDPSIKPIRQPLRRLPLALRDSVSAELKRMQQDDIIEAAEAPTWLSNVVPVLKPDKTLRLCADMTGPNKAIIADPFPLPTMEELSAALTGSTIFSKIDLKAGYHQVLLAPASRDLTAFVTHDGVFRYKRLTMGMCSAVSAFQKIIQHIIQDIPGSLNLLDDILVHGRTVAEHDERLRTVLQRLADHDCTVNSTKCVIGAPELNFNGHRISAAGVQPLTSHVDAILSMPEPRNRKELTRFLATAGYLLKFLPYFATLTVPLRALLATDAPWDWTEECTRAVQALKTRIANPPILAHFNTVATTILTTDASDVGLGACLSQMHGDREVLIAYASRLLLAAERNY